MTRSTTARLLGIAAIVLAASTTTSTALAGDPGLAEKLFADGVDAMRRQDWRAACDAFAGSNDADVSPGAQINLGTCHEKQGKTATAWGWFRTAAGTAEQRGVRDRAELARKEADRLEPSLRRLVISLKGGVEGVTITRDGATLPAATLGREIPVDPGEHVIEAAAKGKKPYRTSVQLAPGPGVDRVEIPALEDAPEDKLAGGALATGAGAGSLSTTSSDGSGQRLAGYLVGAGGVVGLAVSATLFILAGSVDDKADEAQSLLDAEQRKALKSPQRIAELERSVQSNSDDADTNRVAGLVVGGVGIAMIATGAVLVLTAGPSKTESASKASRMPPIVPMLGHGFAGAGATFAF